MRVLAACSMGGAGHLQPLLPVLDATRRRGSETLVTGPPAIADMVTDAGFAFAAGGEPPESVVAPIRERLPIVSAHDAAVLANRELFGALATDAMLASVRELVGSWQPDLVVRDPCEYASAIAARESGTRVVQVAIGLAAVEWSSIEIATPALEARCPGLAEALRSSPYVTRFPRSLDPSPFGDTRRFDTAAPALRGRLPDWWNGSRLPLVYVTLGTVLGHMTIAAEVYRTALRAAGAIDARVLLTVGRRFDPTLLGTVPPNVRVESWVDQSQVLREADVVVCHGGSGTTFGALRAGVPLVVIPLFADQNTNGTTVTESESGLVLDVSRQRRTGQPQPHIADATAIADAIRRVIADPSYREHARQISREMAAAPSVDTVVGALLDR